MNRRIDAAELKRAATGRWLEILVAAGLPADSLDGKGHPCPKCGGRDRFAAWPDVARRGAVHCRHCFTSGCQPGPSDGLATLQWLIDLPFPEACQWLAGWLGLEPVESKSRQPIVRTVSVNQAEPVPGHIERIYGQSLQAMRPDWLEQLAGDLRLPVDAVARMQPGWCSVHHAWTFPMFDDGGELIGIRLRKPTGEKRSVVGSKAGIFIPDGVSGERLFIAEGPTDTAALVALGLEAIGRPSCTGAKPLTVAYARRCRPSEVVIVADHDQAGIQGAESLAAELVRVAPVRLMIPPAKDCRQWFIEGCSADDIHSAVTDAELRTLSIQSEVRA